VSLMCDYTPMVRVVVGLHRTHWDRAKANFFSRPFEHNSRKNSNMDDNTCFQSETTTRSADIWTWQRKTNMAEEKAMILLKRILGPCRTRLRMPGLKGHQKRAYVWQRGGIGRP
jgi:hypothetical protein